MIGATGPAEAMNSENIPERGGDIRASCSCPYDGYPCKLVVAALLGYIKNRRIYSEHCEQAKEEKFRKLTPERRIQRLSHQELAVIVLECAREYSARVHGSGLDMGHLCRDRPD